MTLNPKQPHHSHRIKNTLTGQLFLYNNSIFTKLHAPIQGQQLARKNTDTIYSRVLKRFSQHSRYKNRVELRVPACFHRQANKSYTQI